MLKYLGIGNPLLDITAHTTDATLKEFDLDGNPELSTEIYNFGTTVETCDFRNTNILCYQPGTCSGFVIQDSSSKLGSEADMNYDKCTNTDSNGAKKTSSVLFIILGILILVLLIVGLLFWYNRRRKNEENEDSIYETKRNIYVPPKSKVKDHSFLFSNKPTKQKSFKVLSTPPLNSSPENKEYNNSNSYSNINNNSINSNINKSNDSTILPPIPSGNNNNNNNNNSYLLVDSSGDNSILQSKKPNSSNIDISSVSALQSTSVITPSVKAQDDSNNLGIGYEHEINNTLSMYYSDLLDTSQLSLQDYSFIRQIKDSRQSKK